MNIFCNKKNVRMFDKMIEAIDDPEKHKKVAVLDNPICLKYHIG